MQRLLPALVIVSLGGELVAWADEPKKEKPTAFPLVNKAKDIFVISDKDEPILDYFQRQHVIIGVVVFDEFKKVREAKDTLSQFFINYASQNDDPKKASTFGAHIDVAPPTEAVLKLLGEQAPDGKKAPDVVLILRRDDKKPGLYHVVGCTKRSAVGFFSVDKKNETDGFSQKDLCFKDKP
jgi:hypothetical protein